MIKKERAVLVLANGTVYRGHAFVMTGHQEILTLARVVIA